MGDHQEGIPNNLMPYIARVAVWVKSRIARVFGGTGDRGWHRRTRLHSRYGLSRWARHWRWKNWRTNPARAYL